MRVLIVGLGSIGRRHLENLGRLMPEAIVTVWRHRPDPCRVAESLPSIDRVVYSLEEALEAGPDAALITSPAAFHVETAVALAGRQVHLFIEKPLSDKLEGVDELLQRCRKRSLVLMVGYNLRFYEPLRLMREALKSGRIGRPLSLRAEVGQYLPDWRLGTDYRKGVSARRELGGGAVLELSHELDYARWLMGEVETVSAQTGKLSDLEIDVEDTAEILLRFHSGAIGSIHLDLVQRAPWRSCTIIGTEGTLVWTGGSHCVRLFSIVTDGWSELHPAGAIDRNMSYVAELGHFLDCVQNGLRPLVNGDEGRKTLEIALAAKRSALEQRVVRL